MSDETEHEHEVPEQCDVPGCCFHALMHSRIRTVSQDGENYLNADDLSMWLVNWHAVQMNGVKEQMAGMGLPPNLFQQAVMNNIAGATSVLGMIHEMGHLPIADSITSDESYLVTPESMKDVPDTVPVEWASEKESQ
jgi:hypothetical protein